LALEYITVILQYLTSALIDLLDGFIANHNHSWMHFTYDSQEFYGIRRRKKVLFLPYLRFVCHR
jgi:hypothetical protein